MREKINFNPLKAVEEVVFLPIPEKNLIPISTAQNELISATIKPMLFAGSHSYQTGQGWEDFKGFFDNLEAAKKWLDLNDSLDWAQIIVDGKICERGFNNWKGPGWFWEKCHGVD